MENSISPPKAVADLTHKGIHAGTAATRAILDSLKSPDKKLKIIHIAGSNGKGSTAEFFTRILMAAGKKTGTFTSPAVYSYYDQFRINAKPIEREKFEKYLAVTLKESENIDATAFEIETATALLAFMREGCEYAVIECGMGGLNDATNAVLKKELAVITSVSLEHTAYLGKTLTEICAQKAGIIKNCPAVINALQPSEVLHYFNKSFAVTDKPEIKGEKSFRYKGKQYSLSISSAYQSYNAATAIEGAGLLGIDEGAICEGLKNTAPAGRVEFLRVADRTYILDGAHNPAAFAPIRDALNNLPAGKTKTIIYGCLSDKDNKGNLEMLSHCSESITAVQCKSPRAMPLAEIVNGCKEYFKKVETAQSVSCALDCACYDYVAVCGSFTLLNEAKQWIEKSNENRQ